jgi:pyrroline-5-carboxylate reductase
MTNEKLAIIGGGNMGSAIIRGLINKGYSSPDILLFEIDQKRRTELKNSYNISVSDTIDNGIKEYPSIIIAVKPQNVENVLDNLSTHISEKNLLISVAAGVSTAYFVKILKKNISVVRTMPNIAAQVGEAAVALCSNEYASEQQLQRAVKIMEAIGTVIQVDEKQIDAVTGLSGSGPAFVFLMIEALADGGVLMGLSRERAVQLAVQTVYGAASFLKDGSVHPTRAKEMVTSPGGTTIEGILQLERGGFHGLVMEAVRRSAEKSSFIAENYK